MNASSLAARSGIRMPHDKGAVTLAPDLSYSALKLHDRSRFCWAVVGSPSGAIATIGTDGALLMRLRQDEAERLAAMLTDAATRAATEH